jgi:hypothetical protein
VDVQLLQDTANFKISIKAQLERTFLILLLLFTIYNFVRFPE